MINCVTTQICTTMYTNYCTLMLLNKPDVDRRKMGLKKNVTKINQKLTQLSFVSLAWTWS